MLVLDMAEMVGGVSEQWLLNAWPCHMHSICEMGNVDIFQTFRHLNFAILSARKKRLFLSIVGNGQLQFGGSSVRTHAIFRLSQRIRCTTWNFARTECSHPVWGSFDTNFNSTILLSCSFEWNLSIWWKKSVVHWHQLSPLAFGKTRVYLHAFMFKNSLFTSNTECRAQHLIWFLFVFVVIRRHTVADAILHFRRSNEIVDVSVCLLLIWTFNISLNVSCIFVKSFFDALSLSLYSRFSLRWRTRRTQIVLNVQNVWNVGRYTSCIYDETLKHENHYCET